MNRPSVLVFDVNETLIDIEALAPGFEALFGDRSVLREWFAQLVLYSMTVTLSGQYVDFVTLGRAVLRMIGDIHGVVVTDEDVDRLARRMRTLPAHPDVAEGLAQLQSHGYCLVTLTNSPPTAAGATPLESAGLAGFFERQFSVDALRVFKPSPPLYTGVAAELGVAPADCMMVAAHVWDTIGAQAADMSGALLTRPGNAVLPVAEQMRPTVVAADLVELAELLK
ncbi:haloacid dehalogenase type II [Mycobacterium sp. Y57]|uniref:haloacid dehalogenase type II n=1 Tax=Mycolicibacterium xanthum TaxID=2796469 RepID=UPI001C841DFC|nr:haloacid dehalogenase type II [Mycolicibacterium xanthum]MBX7432925.1 haloacid dehalogenase type II [Mycolicibacterium xanthum]